MYGKVDFLETNNQTFNISYSSKREIVGYFLGTNNQTFNISYSSKREIVG